MFRSLKCALACAAVLMVTTASAEAAPAWLPSVPLSPNGSDAGYVTDIGSDAAGDVIAVWDRYDTANSHNIVEAAIRPAGGDFIVVPLATLGTDDQAYDPRVAVNASGDAVAVWRQYNGADNYVWAAFRPAGGSFGSAVPISDAGATDPRVAIDASGGAVAVWLRSTTHDIVEAAVRPAGGSFGTAAPLSPSDDDSSAATVAMNGAGTAAVAWRYYDSGNTGQHVVQADVIGPGESFPTTPDTISDTSHDSDGPALGIDSSGNTTAIWDEYDGLGHTVVAKVKPAGTSWPSDGNPIGTDANGAEVLAVSASGAAVAAWGTYDGTNYPGAAAVRPPGGNFGPATTFTPAGKDTGSFEPAVNDNGDAVIVYRDDSDFATSAVNRPAGGSFSDPHPLSAAGSLEAHGPAVTLDPFGNAAATWVEAQDDAFDSLRARAAGFDASPPTLSNVSIPDGGTAGSALLFSASASDIWSPVSIGWGFSDGGSGTNSPLSHVFAAPGAYAATVTATDGVGNSTSQTKQLAISAAPQTTVVPGPIPAAADTTAPGISGLSVKPAKFRKRAKVAYGLTEAAKVKVTVERALPGRKVGFRCAAPTKKNRGRKRCTRFKAVKGSLSQNGNAGANTLTLNRRFGGRNLPAGAYRLVVRATDAAGNATVKRVGFKIVR